MTDLQPEDVGAETETHEFSLDSITYLRLSGCEFLVPYTYDKDRLSKAVAFLVKDGHGHHFAVTNEGTSLACSGMAIDCLRHAPTPLLP